MVLFQIFQKTGGILGLEEIPVIKTVTIVQYLLNPLCRDISRPFIRTTTHKDKVAFTQVHFQFLQLQTQGRKRTVTFHKTIRTGVFAHYVFLKKTLISIHSLNSSNVLLLCSYLIVLLK